jgi:putative transposase
MRGPAALEIEIADEERSTLLKWTRDQKTDKRLYIRAKIVLLAAEGWSNTAIAEKLDFRRQSVIDWRKRFDEERIEGLYDRPRCGRPPVFSL